MCVYVSARMCLLPGMFDNFRNSPAMYYLICEMIISISHCENLTLKKNSKSKKDMLWLERHTMVIHLMIVLSIFGMQSIN